MVAQVIEPVAGELTIKVEQGATFDLPMIWSDENQSPVIGLETWTARLHVRKKVTDPTTLLELTTENGGLILGGSVGEVRIFMSDSLTSSLTWRVGSYHLEMVSSTGRVTRLLSGKMHVDSEIAR